MDKPQSVAAPMLCQQPTKIFCRAIDGTMIPGLPDANEHRLLWHEVKQATVFGPRNSEPPFCVAGLEDSEMFGQRL